MVWIAIQKDCEQGKKELHNDFVNGHLRNQLLPQCSQEALNHLFQDPQGDGRMGCGNRSPYCARLNFRYSFEEAH